MGLVSYIVVGAVVGFVAALLSRRPGRIVWDVVLGIIGGLVGGGIARIAGMHGVIHAFNLGSFIIALVCAVVLLAVVEGVRVQRRRARRHYD